MPGPSAARLHLAAVLPSAAVHPAMTRPQAVPRRGGRASGGDVPSTSSTSGVWRAVPESTHAPTIPFVLSLSKHCPFLQGRYEKNSPSTGSGRTEEV